MALIIDNTITNKDISIKSNLAEGIVEASKLVNTIMCSINIAAISAISELMDVRYNTQSGIIQPNTQSK